MNSLTSVNSNQLDIFQPLPMELHQRYTRTLTANTVRSYLANIKSFFGVDDIYDITIEMIQSVDTDAANRYFIQQAEAGLKPTTINQRMVALHSFYEFLCRRNVGIMDYNPFDTKEGCRRFKNPRAYSNTRCLTPLEAKRLVNATSEEDIVRIRDKIIILLLLTTGMRREEITSIKVGDIKTSAGRYIAEIFGKGDKPRIIVINKSIYDLIRVYLDLRGLTFDDTDAWLIVRHDTATSDTNSKVSTNTVYNIVKKYAAIARIDPSTISPHSLRHTFITTSLELGATLEDVQDMSGHASINTTRRYDHVNRMIGRSTADQLMTLLTDENNEEE